MKNNKILAIGIPSYNGEKYLDRCINTFVDEELFDKIEVIIVNDGSTDNTKEIAEKYQKLYPKMVRVINMSYKISKSNFVWQKKFEENKKNIETQLQGVSKAISNIAENIEKNIQNEEQFTKQKKQIVELLKQKVKMTDSLTNEEFMFDSVS